MTMKKEELEGLRTEDLVELLVETTKDSSVSAQDTLLAIKIEALADRLHAQLCGHSHPEVCAFYEAGEAGDIARGLWANYAGSLLNNYPPAVIHTALVYLSEFVSEAVGIMLKRGLVMLDLMQIVEDVRTMSTLITTLRKGAENAKQLARADAEGLGGDQTGGKLPL